MRLAYRIDTLAAQQNRELNISEDRKAFTEQEFALILSKASELARSSDAAGRPSTGFTLKEMKAVALEVGLDPVLIERAARLVPARSSESRLERVLGGPLKYRLDAHFATKLTEKRTAHLLSLVRASVEKQGEAEASSSGMSWNSEIEGSDTFVTAHTEGEGTRVLVSVDRRAALGRHAVLYGLGAFWTFFISASAVSSEPSSWVLAAAVAGGGVGILALARSRWASRMRGTREKVDALMEAVSRSLAESSGDSDAAEETNGPNREGDEPRIIRPRGGGAS